MELRTITMAILAVFAVMGLFGVGSSNNNLSSRRCRSKRCIPLGT